MKNDTGADDVQQQRESNGAKLGGITGAGFLPGESGNPGGRPRGSVSLTAAVRRCLTKADARSIAQKLIRMAKSGDIAAMKLIFERIDSAEVEGRLGELEAAWRERERVRQQSRHNGPTR